MRNEHTSRTLTLGLCGGYFLVLLDVTVVNVALPSISAAVRSASITGGGGRRVGGTQLQAGASGLAWVVDAYTVPLAALLLACGAIGDLLGHRRVVVAGFAGFGAASVVCALAPGLGVLVAGRAAQGVCAALMLPGTLALLARTRHRARRHGRERWACGRRSAGRRCRRGRWSAGCWWRRGSGGRSSGSTCR